MIASLQRNSVRAWVFSGLMRLFQTLGHLPVMLTPPPFRIMQLSMGFWTSCALYVAARLDVATQLGDRGLSLDELARRVGVRPDGLDRLLGLLAAQGLFQRSTDGGWRNNRGSQPLRDDQANGVRALVLMHNSPVMRRPWYDGLEDGLRGTRPPFEVIHGQEFYDYLSDHPETDNLFARAMDQVDALTGDGFAVDFDWGRFKRIIDLGGSNGAKAAAILRRHPTLSALVVDRPAVARQAEAAWCSRSADALSGRMTFAGQDIFVEPPSAQPGDVYFLCAVLHGFGDEDCVDLLSAIGQAAIQAQAPIVVMEAIMPEQGFDPAVSAFDMQMFLCTRGRERTLSQWRALARQAGLRLDQVVHTTSVVHLLVLTPQ